MLRFGSLFYDMLASRPAHATHVVNQPSILAVASFIPADCMRTLYDSLSCGINFSGKTKRISRPRPVQSRHARWHWYGSSLTPQLGSVESDQQSSRTLGGRPTKPHQAYQNEENETKPKKSLGVVQKSQLARKYERKAQRKATTLATPTNKNRQSYLPDTSSRTSAESASFLSRHRYGN